MKAFGDRLKQAREAKSVTIRSVAAATRISERYLHALERTDLEALPGGVFDKGYIKSYAQFLGIDPKPLLESYAIEERKRGRGTEDAERAKLEELARLVQARPSPSARRSFGITPGGLFAGLVGLVLLVLVGATAWVIFRSPEPALEPKPLAAESATVTRSLATVNEPGTESLPPPVPDAVATSDITVQTGVGTGIVDRQLVGRNDRFPEGANVWFWTRIVGGEDGDQVRHVWRHRDRVYMNARLRIGASHWRTYSTLELPPGTAGEWVLEVRGEDGAVLAETRFVCVSPHEGT